MIKKHPPKILVILGPTAVGKSDIAVKLAKQFNGEVVSADSRQVYKNLDIGTGKITKQEMGGIRHHLLNVANPKKQFSVAQYVTLAKRVVEDILSRGKLPIICGGTGFYISALIGNETIPNISPNHALRKELKKKSVTQLFALLKKLNPKRAKAMNNSDKHNPHRLIRAIELAYQGSTLISRSNLDMPYKTLLIGITPEKTELRKRIHARLIKRIKRGMVAEATCLHAKGLSWKRMDELGLEYRYLALFLQKKLSKDEMTQKLSTEIWHYARRQLTWFKRDKKIRWFSPTNKSAIQKDILTFLRM